MATVTISLPESLKTFVDTQIAEKGFGNVSEYFRSLVRDARTKEEDSRLEALLLEGLAGNGIPLDDGFWSDLRADATRLLKQKTAGK